MSPTELLALEKGRIPAQIVLSEIRAYRVEYSPNAPEDEGSLRLLAHKTGLSFDTFVTWLGQENVQSIAFDDVDRIFIAMGRIHLWRTKYREYYEAVNLNIVECAAPGCNTMFEIRVDTLGRPIFQRYCSPQCSRAAYKIRKGRNTTRLPRSQRGNVGRPRKQQKRTSEECRNGHRRTPETIKVRQDGSIECRTCARAAAKRCYEKKKAA